MLVSFFVGSVVLICGIALILFKVVPYLDICIFDCLEITTQISFLI